MKHRYFSATRPQTFADIVFLYTMAAWKASQIEDSMGVVANVQKWLENLLAKQYEQVNQQLFTKLVAEELVSASPSELFLASDGERIAYSVQVIQD